MDELRPWHRQPGETDKAYHAFVTYRNLEPPLRSHARVVSELGKSRALISRWSAEWDWVERAAAWDEEQEIRLLATRIETKKKMDEEHLKIVRAGRNKAVERLRDVDLTDASLTELRYWLDTFMSWERLIIGEPGTIKERRTKIESQDFDIEKEMEALLPIVEDMYRRGILDDSWGDDEEG